MVSIILTIGLIIFFALAINCKMKLKKQEKQIEELQWKMNKLLFSQYPNIKNN